MCVCPVRTFVDTPYSAATYFVIIFIERMQFVSIQWRLGAITVVVVGDGGGGGGDVSTFVYCLRTIVQQLTIRV